MANRLTIHPTACSSASPAEPDFAAHGNHGIQLRCSSPIPPEPRGRNALLLQRESFSPAAHMGWTGLTAAAQWHPARAGLAHAAPSSCWPPASLQPLPCTRPLDLEHRQHHTGLPRHRRNQPQSARHHSHQLRRLRQRKDSVTSRSALTCAARRRSPSGPGRPAPTFPPAEIPVEDRRAPRRRTRTYRHRPGTLAWRSRPPRLSGSPASPGRSPTRCTVQRLSLTIHARAGRRASSTKRLSC